MLQQSILEVATTEQAVTTDGTTTTTKQTTTEGTTEQVIITTEPVDVIPMSTATGQTNGKMVSDFLRNKDIQYKFFCTVFELVPCPFSDLTLSQCYHLHTGAALDLKPLNIREGASIIHCTLLCNADPECLGVKIIENNNNYKIICKMFKNSDGMNVV